MSTYLKMKDGFNFKSKIYNEVDHTYFGCANWRGLAKAYGFQPGMVITFHIGTYYQNDEDIWVDLDLIAVLPLGKFLNKLVVTFRFQFTHNLSFLYKIYSLFSISKKHTGLSRRNLLHCLHYAYLAGKELPRVLSC